VLNALSRANRARVIERVRGLLAADGRAYLAVARDLPITGKLGMQHSLQNYVVLTLPTVFEDQRIAIYVLDSQAVVADKTRDYLSRRDRRRLR